MEEALYSRPRPVEPGRDGTILLTDMEKRAFSPEKTVIKDKLEELRDYYDTTDTSESVERAQWDERVLGPDEVMVSTSIRLPRSLMQRVRERAAEAGVPATALMRQWVLDRLEAGEDDEVVPVADLKRLIAERARRAA